MLLKHKKNEYNLGHFILKSLAFQIWEGYRSMTTPKYHIHHIHTLLHSNAHLPDIQALEEEVVGEVGEVEAEV